MLTLYHSFTQTILVFGSALYILKKINLQYFLLLELEEDFYFLENKTEKLFQFAGFPFNKKKKLYLFYNDLQLILKIKYLSLARMLA